MKKEVMAKEGDPVIRVSNFVWVELNRLKTPGDTFNDVMKKLLLFYKKNKEETLLKNAN